MAGEDPEGLSRAERPFLWAGVSECREQGEDPLSSLRFSRRRQGLDEGMALWGS